MANGLFLGGFAEGMETSAQRDIKERTLASDTALRGRALDIQESQLDRQFKQDQLKEIDAQIANTMGIVAETIKSATAVGRDPASIEKTVAPLVASAKALAARVGRNPAALDAQVQAQITAPGLVETAGATGTAKGTARVAEQKAVNAAGITLPADPKVIEAENKLRDDYQKQSKDFVIIRDFKDRIDNVGKTGAGDLAIIFSYMKILDPPSTVREGEQANAQNAAGVPETIRGMYNNVVGGGKLSDAARAQFKQEAQNIFGKAADRHSKMTNRFADIAKRQGLNPKNVIVDVLEPEEREQTFDDRWSVTPGGLKFRVPK